MVDPNANANPAPHPCADARLPFEGEDARADNRTRTIIVAREAVAIRRSIAGVAMTIRVPATAYNGVALCVAHGSCGDVRRELRLTHRDPELSVLLAAGEDETVIKALWRDWASFFGLPALMERTERGAREPSVDIAESPRPPPHARRGGKPTAMRRPRFLARRKTGDSAFAATVHADPRVLIPGSKPDR